MPLPLEPPPDRPAAPLALSQRQKAAVIVRFLLNEGADLPLTGLPDDVQAELIQLIGSMRYVDRDTLSAVVMEFAGQLENVALSFPGGLGDALTALDGRISPLTAARLRKEAGVRDAGDPWERLRGLDIDTLLGLIETESTEVCAVLLSKLEVSRAAELLGALPGDQARRIAYAVSQTGGISPEAVDRIGLTLAAQLDEAPQRAFEAPPDDRLGAILNCSGQETRDALLAALQEEDEGFAAQVRRAIFTFAHIPARVAPRDVPRVLRDIDPGVVVTALASDLAGDDAAAMDFLMGNMSARMADQLRDDAADRGKVRPRDTEAACTRIAATVLSLATEGEIDLRPPDDPEDDG